MNAASPPTGPGQPEPDQPGPPPGYPAPGQPHIARPGFPPQGFPPTGPSLPPPPGMPPAPGMPPGPFPPAPNFSPQPGPGWGPGVTQPPSRPSNRAYYGFVAGLSVLLLALLGGGIVWLNSTTTIEDLVRGDCLTWQADADLQGADDLSKTDCDQAHDAEVIFAGLVGPSGVDDVRQACVNAVSAEVTQHASNGLEIRPLTKTSDVNEDDVVLCVVRTTDGSRLTSPVS